MCNTAVITLLRVLRTHFRGVHKKKNRVVNWNKKSGKFFTLISSLYSVLLSVRNTHWIQRASVRNSFMSKTFRFVLLSYNVKSTTNTTWYISLRRKITKEPIVIIHNINLIFQLRLSTLVFFKLLLTQLDFWAVLI